MSVVVNNVPVFWQLNRLSPEQVEPKQLDALAGRTPLPSAVVPANVGVQRERFGIVSVGKETLELV